MPQLPHCFAHGSVSTSLQPAHVRSLPCWSATVPSPHHHDADVNATDHTAPVCPFSGVPRAHLPPGPTIALCCHCRRTRGSADHRPSYRTPAGFCARSAGPPTAHPTPDPTIAPSHLCSRAGSHQERHGLLADAAACSERSLRLPAQLRIQVTVLVGRRRNASFGSNGSRMSRRPSRDSTDRRA